MKNKKKVLVTGIGQVNYIFQLYGPIIPELPNYRFNSLNLRSFGNVNKKKAENIFSKNFDYRYNFSNLFETFAAILHIILDNYFWKHLRVLFSDNGLGFITQIMPAIKEHITAFQLSKFIDEKTETDVIHLHFPKQEYALFINYLKGEYQIILTYWGSDIFRINQRVDHEIQKLIIPLSDIITVTTPEMKYSLITRYGSGFENKIKIAQFIHDGAFYELAHKFIQNQSWKPIFKKNKEIPANKKIILFGHNASSENNHLKFLASLKLVPSQIVERYHIIFPLTYPKKKKYIEKIKSSTQEVPTTFSFLTEFMAWEDLVKLKIVSDVYIHGPITDGLSAFLTEFFYTNNLAIVGSWLPYKTFLKYGIKYLEFDDFGELITILQNLDDYSVDTSSNKEIIEKKFNSFDIKKEWLKVFNDLPK